jgi:hypothetical protein
MAPHGEKDYIFLALTDERSIKSPLKLYPTLQKASDLERTQFEIVGRRIGLHSPMREYDLCLEGMLNVGVLLISWLRNDFWRPAW